MALGAALSSSSSTSAESRSSFLPKIKLLRYANPNPSLFFLCFSTTHSPRSISNHTVVSSNLLSTSPPPLPLPFGGNWISSSSIFSSNGNVAIRRRRSNDDFHGGGVVQATSETAAANPTNSLMETLKLALLFLVWYFVNIYFNLINKQLLKVYPYPLTISASQFGIGTLLILFMWTFGLYKRPNITTSQLVSILPLAIGHTLGNLFTNVSLVKVAVSFTHTIKAMEPFFTVVLSALFLGQMPTLGVVSSLVPVVGGVALASLTEASFDWVGFWSAMASNFTNQSRNVFSKKLMAKEESMDNITLFSIITIMSFILTIPVSICMEGFKFTPSYLQSAGLNVQEIFLRALLGGILYHAYQQISYMILQKVSPVSHSVSNCLKRVVVIVASVLFFQTPVSPVNCFGTAVALFGVCLYSRVKLIKPESKTT